MIRRREFITLLGGAATVGWPLAASAQQVSKSYRIAFLALVGDEDAEIVKQRLGELGYIEGKNLNFDYRSAEGQLERLPQLAADFVKTTPDVIVAGFGTAPARAAQAATASIPIVFTSAGDPIGTGIVKSLSRPGANITGLNSQAAEINGKRLQILEDLAPGIRDVAVLMQPDAPFTAGALKDLQMAAEARGLHLRACEIRAASELESRMEATAKAGATGLVILETGLLLRLRQRIVDLAAGLRLVAIYNSRAFVDAGGLLSYGADRWQLYRRAPELVDKILRTCPGAIAPRRGLLD
jgi:putative tryptophan/tyrosine transport system substrate-binding protein